MTMADGNALIPADDLAVRAARGDDAARRQLFRALHHTVHAFLFRVLGLSASPDRVADLAQETWLKVFQSLPRFQPGGAARLSTWVLTIAQRTALNRLRRERLAPEELPDEAVGSGADPEAALASKELGARLVEAVDALPAEYRAAFLLREYHGLTYEEIAQSMGLEVGTVRSRLARARAHLRTALSEDGLHE